MTMTVNITYVLKPESGTKVLKVTLTYFSMFSTDESYIPIFSYTKLFLVDLRPNNKVVFSCSTQET